MDELSPQEQIIFLLHTIQDTSSELIEKLSDMWKVYRKTERADGRTKPAASARGGAYESFTSSDSEDSEDSASSSDISEPDDDAPNPESKLEINENILVDVPRSKAKVRISTPKVHTTVKRIRDKTKIPAKLQA